LVRHGLRLVAVRQPPHQVKLTKACHRPVRQAMQQLREPQELLVLALLVQQALVRLLAGGLQALLRVLPLPGGRLLVAAPPARFAACAPPMSHAVEASAATTAMEIFPAAAATLRVQHVALMKHS